MTVLITGGAGFLGQHLTWRLLEQDTKVIVYDLSIDNAAQNLLNNSNVVLVKGDIRDVARLRKNLKTYQVNVVVHLATLLTANCEDDPIKAADVNCRGTAAVFEAAICSGVKRVVFGSSVAVFNDNPDLSWGDDRPYGPPSVYGATKVFCEQLARTMQRSRSGIEFIGIRFGYLYGPGRVRGWTEIQEVINDFALEKEIVDYPDYQYPNDWTYIDDAIEATLRCLGGPVPERIILNFSGDYRRIDEAVGYLQKLFPDVQTKPYQALLPPVGWRFKSDGISSLLGYSYQIGLEQGLERTVASIREAHGLPPLAVN